MVTKLPNSNESFELKGYWWLPEKPDQKIAGIFKYNPDKMELSLMGAFSEIKDMGMPKEYEIILGATPQGDLVTLRKCYQSSYTFSAPGYPTEIFFVLESYIGYNFTNPDEIKFKRITLNLSNLDEWVGISSFKTDYSEYEKSKTVSIKYTHPNEMKFKINEQMHLIIGFGYTLGSTSTHQMSRGIIQTTAIIIESKTEIPFTDFLKAIHDLKNFLSLAMLEPVYELKVKGFTENNQQTVENKKIMEPITVYYLVFNMPIEVKKIHSMHMLFNYTVIAEKFEKYYQTWITNKEILQPIYNLYFGVIYNKNMYLDQKFLELIQAVESFHRRTSTQTDLPEKDHKTRIEKILSSAPSEHKNWLEKRLLYSNELTLRKRLNTLIEQFPQVIDDYSLNKYEFVNLVVNTRNYLTHFDKSLESKAADNTKKHELCQRLMLLVEACLLSKLGFETEKITFLIETSKRNKGIKNP